MSVKKVVVIEINDYGTKLCEMGYNKKNPPIYQCVEFKNPEMAVEDGFIVNRMSYIGVFKEELRRSKIKCKDVIFTLTSNKVLNREIIIPIMKEKLIRDYIESERDSFFPMDTRNHILTYNIIETKSEEKQLRIIVYAAPTTLIKNYETLAAELDLAIVAIEYNGNTIYQWLRRNRQHKLDFYLQINEQNTMFTILDNGMLALQRNMNFGTEVLIQNLMETDTEYVMDEVEASLVLMEGDNFYPSFKASTEVNPQDEEQAREHAHKVRMTDQLRLLVGNISRVLEYYNTKNREAIIKTIYIGGTGARLKGLKELLENELMGLEFELLVELPGLNLSKGVHSAFSSSEFIACIGASYPSINFVKEDEGEKVRRSLVVSTGALAGVVVVSVILVISSFIAYRQAIGTRDEFNLKIARLSEIEVLEKQYIDAKSNLEESIAMDLTTYRYNEEWNDIMLYLESELPSATVITSIASTNSMLTMNVTLNSKEEAAKFLLQLKNIKYFTSISINGLTEVIDADTGIKTVTFSVACAYYEEETNSEAGSDTATDITQDETSEALKDEVNVQ